MKVDTENRIEKAVAELEEKFHFDSKTVLDIGCGTGDMVRRIATKYHPKVIIGIDQAITEDSGENFILQAGDARRLEFEDNSFDFIYSVSTFEHINGIAETLSEVRRVLKPRGRFYTSFAPLWTSICGHHCYSYSFAFSKGFVGEREEKIVWGIPAWGHLYMNKEEMREHLSKNGFEDYAIYHILSRMYDNNDLNRRTASETRHDITNCGMIIKAYHEWVTFSRQWALDQKGPSELTADILNKLKRTKYNLNDIGVVNMWAELEKYERLIV